MSKQPKIKQGEKMFVVRKYIMARSASDAIRKDKTFPVDDVFVDEDFKNSQPAVAAIGYCDNTTE